MPGGLPVNREFSTFNKTEPESVGSISSLAAGSSYTTNIIDLTSDAAIEIEVVLHFGTAPSSGGVQIALLPSQDGTNLANESISVGAAYPSGTDWRYIVPVNVVSERYAAVKITNNTDQACDVTVNVVHTRM